jgi:hypothetical protein
MGSMGDHDTKILNYSFISTTVIGSSLKLFDVRTHRRNRLYWWWKYTNKTKLLKWFGFIVLNQTITNFSLKKTKLLNWTELLITNRIELFQFGFKIIGYSSVFFGSVRFNLPVRFGFFVHPKDSWPRQMTS